MNVENRGPMEVSGKPGTAHFGGLVPSMFGKTTLRLYSERVVETTKRVVARRDSQLLVSEIDSVEITARGSALWLGLGILTIGLYGFGIIFFILYFVVKHRFLIVRSKSNVQILGMTGDDEPYRQFMHSVLQAAQVAKRSP